MITKSDVKQKQAQELKDLDVDRVDGVDKPATGRNFLLFKRGQLTDAILAQQVEQDGAVDPEDARDALGRSYLDEVYDTLGGLNASPTDASPIPDAGAGETRETTTEDIAYKPQRFTAAIGGRLGKPVQPYVDNEVGEAGSQPVRVGPNFLMSPQNSGIAEPLDFKKPEPTTVLKRERGVFRSMLDPRDGEVSNFFGPAQSDSKVAKAVRDGGSRWTSVVYGE